MGRRERLVACREVVTEKGKEGRMVGKEIGGGIANTGNIC